MLTQQQFAQCFSLLLGNEGGYSNNPHDPGGETMWGITKRVALRWGYEGEMKKLSLEDAQRIAKSEYWDIFQCDRLPLAVAFQVFDTAYNGGMPIKWLEQLTEEPTAGHVTQALIEALEAMNPWEVVAKFNAKRLQYLASLKQLTFADGRMNRIASNLNQGGLK